MTTAPGTALDVDALTVRYPGRVALDNVTFTAGWGELVAVVGPNGAGKSTLFKAIAGLVPITGHVTLAGDRCHHGANKACAAYLPQRADVDLSFPLTVGQLVLAGRRPFLAPWRRPRPVDRHAVADALEEVDLADRTRDPIGALSGGQLQRALVARALAQQAEVLLLDEALAGVDLPNTTDLLTLFDRLARTGRTILVATHDLALCRRHFDRCLALNTALIADGPPQDALDADSLDATYGTAPPPRPSRSNLVAAAG
ncbi:MAG: metal ABC transporter ATP-binding protein [Acidimicrobiales bacterium]|jgi:ABC-type Mn2+/Zn2+ transport system ATPase subunit|nr:metal ABC transporter ATP-binding protein [Acidimicrobiales bacterium]